MLFLFLHTGETRAKYLENVGSRIREERFTPRYRDLTVQTRFLASTPNPWLASSSDSCFIASGR